MSNPNIRPMSGQSSSRQIPLNDTRTVGPEFNDELDNLIQEAQPAEDDNHEDNNLEEKTLEELQAEAGELQKATEQKRLVKVVRYMKKGYTREDTE